MDEGFLITVEYKEKPQEFEAKFVRVGYIHQFHVNVDGASLIFEFDEERNYRVMNANADNNKVLDPGLIEAIVQKISSFHD